MLGKLDMAPPQKDQSIWRHYIPGWFGMSRSLEGMFNGNMGQERNVDVHIIGIFKLIIPKFNILTLVEYKY